MNKIFLAVIMGLLVAIFIMGNIPQQVVDHGVSASYAMGPSNPGGNPSSGSTTTKHVPEPSMLSLIGMGVAGIGIYLFSKRKKK